MIASATRLSYAELTPRERIEALVDEGTFREVLDPFARASSPYLIEQGISPQRDDGVVIGPARLDGRDIAAIAVDGRFLGGSVGEVGGAKIARALERAVDGAFLLLDTGGIRLQEANLGLLAVAEICDAVVALRERAPIVAVVAGRVGCYGGMSIVASLCSSIVMSNVGRLGLNGPEVVEQEAGIREFDSRDRPAIWQATGGVRRVAQGHADVLVSDEIAEVRQALLSAFRAHPNRNRLNVERLGHSFSEELGT
jgi:malonate decarboxylase beta subunit